MKRDNLEKFREDLERLLHTGKLLLVSLEYKITPEYSLAYNNLKRRKKIDFKDNYEKWYTEALEVIRQTLPRRLNDFVALYSHGSYTIIDFLIGVVPSIVVNDNEWTILGKFKQQVVILESAIAKFESSLFIIKQIVQADIFDSEIDVARELHKNGYLRASGIVTGVVLENHLREVCIGDDHQYVH